MAQILLDPFIFLAIVVGREPVAQNLYYIITKQSSLCYIYGSLNIALTIFIFLIVTVFFLPFPMPTSETVSPENLVHPLVLSWTKI